MIHYRPFVNTDIPLVTEIWRSHPPLRGLVHSISSNFFEQHVLSKAYFDRLGLILAVEEGQPLGFIHIGFGANEYLDDIQPGIAVVSMLMVAKSGQTDSHARAEIAHELLRLGEEYAREHGASRIFGGGTFPNNPFYLGLYGGSRLPGILESDNFSRSAFESKGYSPDTEIGIWQIELAGFRTVVNREQMQIRRQYNIRAEFDPPLRSWWEASTLGHAERMKFQLIKRGDDAINGEVNFWDMQPLASDWGIRAAGMFDILVEPGFRRGGLATYLIGEALRQLKDHGFTVAEVQTRLDDEASVGLFEKLGFKQIDKGILFDKSIA